MMMFRGRLNFLSNMYPVTFTWNGRTYRNSEAAFQSAKTLDPAERNRFSTLTGVAAKRAGRQVRLRSDWDRVKLQVMEDVLRAKFTQNPALVKRLIDTGDAVLQEGNYWHDTFWGVDAATGEGENHLGVILMQLREELGGEDYLEKVARMRREREEAERQARESLQAQIDGVRAELEALPSTDFTGMQMNTRAFGRITILRQEGEYLFFEARGTTKKFALPGCIVQGFLIPDDPEVLEVYARREELQARLKALEKRMAEGVFGASAPEPEAGESYREEARDLFSVPEGWCLAHCISADFNMGKGIVVEFDRRFGLGEKLKALWPNYAAEWKAEGRTSDCLRVENILNLVTKARYSQKPTYDSVRGALEQMRDICLEQGIERVAMPRIGCGLDRLSWDKVSQIIREVFEGTDVEILVCLGEKA